jgi:hypothetical protein
VRFRRRRTAEPAVDLEREQLLADLADAVRGCQSSVDRAVVKYPDLAYLVDGVPRFCADEHCPAGPGLHLEHT